MLGLKGDMQEKNIAWGFESISFPESSGGCLDVAISRAKLSNQKLPTSSLLQLIKSNKEVTKCQR